MYPNYNYQQQQIPKTPLQKLQEQDEEYMEKNRELGKFRAEAQTISNKITLNHQVLECSDDIPDESQEHFAKQLQKQYAQLRDVKKKIADAIDVLDAITVRIKAQATNDRKRDRSRSTERPQDAKAAKSQERQ